MIDSKVFDQEKMDDLTKTVSQALETSGILGKIKANLRASVFDVLHGQEMTNDNSRVTSVQKNPREMLLAHLVRDYMEHYDLSFTRSTFDAELCFEENDLSRSELENRLGSSIQFSNKGPLLLQIVDLLMEGKMDGKKSTGARGESNGSKMKRNEKNKSNEDGKKKKNGSSDYSNNYLLKPDLGNEYGFGLDQKEKLKKDRMPPKKKDSSKSSSKKKKEEKATEDLNVKDLPKNSKKKKSKKNKKPKKLAPLKNSPKNSSLGDDLKLDTPPEKKTTDFGDSFSSKEKEKEKNKEFSYADFGDFDEEELQLDDSLDISKEDDSDSDSLNIDSKSLTRTKDLPLANSKKKLNLKEELSKVKGEIAKIDDLAKKPKGGDDSEKINIDDEVNSMMHNEFTDDLISNEDLENMGGADMFGDDFEMDLETNFDLDDDTAVIDSVDEQIDLKDRTNSF